MDSLSLEIPSAFIAHIDPLLARLRYLYPNVLWSFDTRSKALSASFDSEAYSSETLAKEASFQLYREKIYHDTLDIRRKLYEAI